mmetsp:Transcript_41149/g.99811  ORF Transcript_41149/g.99811 Transcript_41149/m.99811 type:complete len:476 (+) Transcript_41149:578-2005(+)
MNPQMKKEQADDMCSDGECGSSPMLDALGQPLDPNEEKRLKRMRRNRESAAMSRNRKKMYVEELEARVVELTANVHQLQQQNAALQQENAALRAGSPLAQPKDPSTCAGPSAAPSTAVSNDLPLGGDGHVGEDARGEERHPASSGGKKSGVSAASLALMSALTFVTFSAVQSTGGQSKHGPGARALMSLDEMPPVPESISGLLQRARNSAMTGEQPLWPALKPLIEHSATLLSAFDDEKGTADEDELLQSESAPSPPSLKLTKAMSSSRVIKLPHNSSWGDALRFEALEGSLARRVERAISDPKEERALVHHDVTTHDADLGQDWSQPTRVYDSIWSKSRDGQQLSAEEEEERDEQRYIFCSRAYMFDAVEPLRSPRSRSSGSTPPAPTSPLPAAMPARFRHAAQQHLPQLTDGNTNSTPQTTDRFGGPTVKFLLPSAALRGIVSTDVHKELDANLRTEDLMQITCQVTNVSRVS